MNTAKLPRRTPEQIKRHYDIESALATKIKKAANREERAEIYATMYDELFSQVPDHPRLTKRDNSDITAYSNSIRMPMVANHINKDTVFAEFAPGDCKFAYYISDHVKKVVGVDISDQRSEDFKKTQPTNFDFMTYDGYTLPIEQGAVDIFFSDQLVEHIHPDETKDHYRLVYEALKTGGKYVFRIPHRLSGPYDISLGFTETPTGFHLNEPIYREIFGLVREVGFSKINCYWNFRKINFQLPYFYFSTIEKVLINVPYKIRRPLSKLFIPNLVMLITK